MSAEAHANVVLVEDVLWVVTRPTGMPVYDFDFESFFACRHPYPRPERVCAAARMGAASDYPARYGELLEAGVEMVHTPAEYERTSLLPTWYPLIEDLTARSRWWANRRPNADEVEAEFAWPVFVKGIRQTSKHQKSMSVAENREDFERILASWDADPILWWQGMVCREYLALRKVGESSAHALPASFEFRTFWWRGNCVGIGPYWTAVDYRMEDEERRGALAVAGEAARRVGVTFLVVDVAQTVAGKWVVIECNDGQDSGYAGVSPMLMWRKVLEAEKARGT
jgi:hypothetical protein